MLILRTKHSAFVYLGICALVLGALLFSWNRSEARRRLEAERKLSETLSLNSELSNRFSAVLAERQDVEARLKETESHLVSLADRLVYVYRKMDELKADALQMKTDYDRTLQEKEALQSQLNERDARIQDLLRELLEARDRGASGVDLGSVSVTPGSGGTVSVERDSLEGEVIAVNQDLHFLVVNLGQRDGVVKGSQLTVLRAGRSIGTAKVEMIQDSVAAASLASTLSPDLIQTGDQVRVLQP